MAKIRIVGDSSGYVELAAPNAAGNNTLELPSNATKLVGADASNSLNVTGIVTATGGFSGNINSTGVSTITTLRTTSIVGVTTAGITTVYTNSINNGQLGGSRNMIINGSMVVNQRGWTGAAGTSVSGAYTTDRFVIDHTHDGAVSAGQTTMNSTVGGNAYVDGFQNALIFRVTTADSSLSAGQYQTIQQRIEGYNLQGIKKGTANAQPVTLSFWVRSNTTGTYIIELFDDDNTRQVSQAYTINSANTWEKKVLTFPADTTGVFNNDNALSLYVFWWLAAGSTYSSGTLNTSWAANTQANRAVGQTNLLATAGNDFFLTGVQLEVGDRATEFERRSYGQELALAQRYYQRYFPTSQEWIYLEGNGSTLRWWFLPIRTPMRIAPNTTFSSGMTGGTIAGLTGTISSLSLGGTSVDRVSVRVTTSTNDGIAYQVRHTDGFEGDYVELSSEL